MSERRSRCAYRHKQTETIDGEVYGLNFCDRQWRRGSYPIEAPSSEGLPFFKSHPDKPYDEHYCGCMGWD